jgi:hypothetical protein
MNAKSEFNQMIFEIATHEGDLRARALVPVKRLVFLKAEHVPESLRSDLQQLKDLGETAKHMTVEESRNFITRILSFDGKLNSN